MQAVVLQDQVFVFISELARLSIDLLQMTNLALHLADLRLQSDVDTGRFISV